MTQNPISKSPKKGKPKGKPPSQRKIEQTLKLLKTSFSEIPTDAPELPSKSAKKRQSTAVQALGERLAELPRERLAQLPLDDSLRDALEQAASISNHEGRRRQLQYVGKLMRYANVELIAAELDKASDKNRAQIGLEHAAESWRSRLLEGSDGVALWTQSYPDFPIGAETAGLISKLTDPHSRETPEGRRRYRDLYRFIKDALSKKMVASNE
jgi:ribosome-associated protein